MEIKRLVIPREKWGSGAMLISKPYPDEDDGKMCCLGHLAKACGSPDRDLRNYGMPTTSVEARYPKAFKTSHPATDWGAQHLAAEINDSKTMSGPEKERKLKILFGSRGIKLEFAGKGRP